jgi:hypothetical protein
MNRASSHITGASASRSTRILFGFEGCISDRHPRLMLSAVIALVLTADRIADLAAGLIARMP